MAKKQSYNLDKITIFWSSCGLLLIILFLISFYSYYPSGDEVKLVIDFGDGYSRSFLTSHREGSNAWDMLQQANAIYGIPLSVENHFKPKAIGDKENGEEGKKWNFYLDGKAHDEPFRAQLSGGEVVMFKFE